MPESSDTPPDPSTWVIADLTTHQQVALEAAVTHGFFERPQGATAGEIAEVLGVSRSTFLYHLRLAEQAVFEDVLDLRREK